MEIIDFEQRLLSQKILTDYQINEIRYNFISILGINKTHFGLNEFKNLIYQLVENNQVQQELIEQYFQQFDQNKDGKLDWNEYLEQFMGYITKVDCLSYLRALVSLEDQSLYLQQLQLAFLAQPFRKMFPTTNLLKVEQTLILLENQSSNKIIKKYYFLCRETIETYLEVSPNDIFTFQDFNNLGAQIITVLRLLLQQRLPHIKIYKREYAASLILEIQYRGYINNLFKMLHLDDERDQLVGLQALTLLIATVHIFKIPIDLQFQPALVIDAIFNLIQDTQNDLIIKQSYIFLGHLCLLDYIYSEYLLTKRQNLLDITITDDEQLLYHSWLIGCIFQRYEINYGLKYIQRMNQLDDNLLWMSSLLNYYNTYGLLQYLENNQLRIQIQINMLILISPLLATQIHQDILIVLLQQLQNHSDNRFRIQIITTIKYIFKLPQILKFQNFNAQNLLLSNNLLNILILLITDKNLVISYKAKKLFFKTLCLQNYGLLIRYLLESNNLQPFLYVLENYLRQQNDLHFKYQIATILKHFSQDSNMFYHMSKGQWLFQILFTMLQGENSKNFNSNNQTMINCQGDYYIIKEISDYCSIFNIHFQNFLRSKQPFTPQTQNSVLNILPSQNIINQLQQYLSNFFENLDKYQPLILKKYLKLIYFSFQDIIQCFISLFTQLLIEQINGTLLFSSIQYLLKEFQSIQDYLIKKKEFIDDTLLIVGTEATYDGCVVATVYLNTYKDATKCKIVLKPQLTLLDFEQQVERGLNLTSPLLYLVIDQNNPNKIPYDDLSIIDESSFKKFKQLADHFIDTQYGSVKVPQEVIAVQLHRLKVEDYSMKKIYEILTKGSSYYQFKKIQDNQMLWFLENNSDSTDKGQIMQQIYNLTKLPYNYIENIFNSINDYFQRINIQFQYRAIVQAEFIDYLIHMKIPNSLAQKIALFLQKNGLANPIDLKDFICFIAVFYHQNFNESIILKFTYLLYVDDNGNFGEEQLQKYLENIFRIQEQNIDEIQIKQWATQLLKQADQNQDGYISFHEYHVLLNDPQYRNRLLQPLCQTFTNLPFESMNRNNIFFGTPKKLFGN